MAKTKMGRSGFDVFSFNLDPRFPRGNMDIKASGHGYSRVRHAHHGEPKDLTQPRYVQAFETSQKIAKCGQGSAEKMS